MRGSLGQQDVSTAQRLDEELRRSATEASIVRSKIKKEDLEDITLSYDIPTSVILRAPGPEEQADVPHEGFVSIYELEMQQVLRLPMRPFLHKVMRDSNMALC
ncbi:hypothetical protein Adt_04148 [Abeliophyllum distichum]|uniref:Uncharacterized protein n=1 Tax=Abeliophyllum distichum TaxID=126358 RepID=A0ABD1W0K9_9LAMI